MTSEPIRDPLIDHLLTPQNSALVVIDYQPFQLEVVTSMDRDLLIRNIVSVARTARTFGLPIVLSTVGVAASGREPTIPELDRAIRERPVEAGVRRGHGEVGEPGARPLGVAGDPGESSRRAAIRARESRGGDVGGLHGHERVVHQSDGHFARRGHATVEATGDVRVARRRDRCGGGEPEPIGIGPKVRAW